MNKTKIGLSLVQIKKNINDNKINDDASKLIKKWKLIVED